MKPYTLKHVVEVCELSERQARALVDLIQPARGKWRRFDGIDLLRLGILTELRHKGKCVVGLRECDCKMRQRIGSRNNGLLAEMMFQLDGGHLAALDFCGNQPTQSRTVLKTKYFVELRPIYARIRALEVKP